MSVFCLQNNNIKLRLTPGLGCHWLSLQIKQQKRWTHLLVPAPNLKAVGNDPFNYGLYLMTPWCNRLPRAAFKFNGKFYQLQSNFPDGSAIHGDVGRHPWVVRAHKKNHFSAELDTNQITDFNFPFPLLFRHDIQLQGSNLLVRLLIQNSGDQSVPVGAGFHPFFKRWLDSKRKDALHVDLPYDQVYPQSGPFPQKKSRLLKSIFSEPFPWNLSNRELDHTFTGSRSARALVLTYPLSGLRIEMKKSATLPHLFIYSPRKHNQRRADFSCIEPMSMLPNGFAGLSDRKKAAEMLLKPGQWLKTEIKLSFSYRL